MCVMWDIIYGMCKVGCCGPRKEGEDKDEEDMVMRMETPTTLCLFLHYACEGIHLGRRP